MYKFTVTQKVDGYTHIEEDYRKLEIEQTFECGTFDDLRDLLLTLVDYSTKPVRVEIRKEVTD